LRTLNRIAVMYRNERSAGHCPRVPLLLTPISARERETRGQKQRLLRGNKGGAVQKLAHERQGLSGCGCQERVRGGGGECDEHPASRAAAMASRSCRITATCGVGAGLPLTCSTACRICCCSSKSSCGWSQMSQFCRGRPPRAPAPPRTRRCSQ
jgi:hypothetical protein